MGYQAFFETSVKSLNVAVGFRVVRCCLEILDSPGAEKLLPTAEVNCVPLSVVIASGMPNMEIHPCRKASTTLSVVMSFIGMAAGHRVKRSTIVRRCLKPFETGIVTISAFK